MSSRGGKIVQKEVPFVKVKVVKPDFLTIAGRYLASKLSVIAVDANKASIGRWSDYQKRLMTDGELRHCFSSTSNAYGVALICGQVSSGGLETLDFDNKVPGHSACAYNVFSDTVKAERPELFEKLVINTTPSGGHHIRYICTKAVIPGNTKLAEVAYQAKGKTQTLTLIETRGEGGYAVAPPTPGYELIQGHLSNLPNISADDRQYLLNRARQFNQVERQPEVKPVRNRPTYTNIEGGLTPEQAIERYNEITDTADLLQADNWRYVGTGSRGHLQFRRPGKAVGSHSASYDTETKKLYNFSTNASLPVMERGHEGRARGLSPFAVYALLHYNGDHTAATRQLYAEHPEWSIPPRSKTYNPGRQEQAAHEAQLVRLADLYSDKPENVRITVDSRDDRGGSAGKQKENEGFWTRKRKRFSLLEVGMEQDPSTGLDRRQQMQQSMQDNDPSIIELMKWTPGTGKTHAAEAVAVGMANRGQNTIFAMQSNERAEQEAAAMRERFGYQAAVIKGRNADNCTEYESAEALGKGGHSVRQNLCLHCPARPECSESGYLSQFDHYQKGRTNIAFMSIESAVELLKDNKGNSTLKADVLVFDENPDRMAMQEHRLTVNQLDNINPSTDQVGAVVDLLSELVISVKRHGKIINDWSRLQGRIESILKRFRYKGGVHAELAIDTERVLREVVGRINETSRNLIDTRPEAVARTEPRWLANITSELKRLISAESPVNVCLVVTEDQLVFRQGRTINPKAKMVILDAYGRPELYEQVFNRAVRLHQHQVKPNWRVYYMPMNTSRTRLKDDRPGRWTSTKWQQVIKNKTSLFEFERMVVFVDGKETVKKAESAVESLGLGDKVTVDYFYRGRGTNKYQDFDAVMILGQAEPRSDVMVSECRALHRDGEYIGSEVKNSNKRQFKDHRLQQFKESRQVDEIVQAIYRIRPATHQHRLGKKVVICTAFEVEGVTDQAEVVQFNSKSIEAEIRRAKLADQVSQYLSKYSYMTLASGLNSRLAEIGGGSESGHGLAELAYNNRDINSLISNLCITSHSKDFSVSVRTVKDDLKKLVDDGVIEAHRESVVLDGKTYPIVVYGSLDAFKADVDQAISELAEQDRSANFSEANSPSDAAEVEPLPFDQDVAEILEQYRISRDQWPKVTLGGELVAITFAGLIGQVDDSVRAIVLKILKPEIFSTNLALKQVLDDRPSGLKMLGRWSG